MQTKFDWADIAFASKKPLKGTATLVLAPRELSSKRLLALVKELLPKGDIVLGVAKEAYVAGFEGQTQFRALTDAAASALAEKIAKSDSAKKLYLLEYFTSETDVVVEKLLPKHVIVVRGSYAQTFHTRSTFYALNRLRIPFSYASPFVDEAEAKMYEKQNEVKIADVKSGNEVKMLALAQTVATQSFDYSFQTGCVLAKKNGAHYTVLATGFNKVIPYQTYAMHYGNAREDNASLVHDANHYDTIHAEMQLLVKAQQAGLSLVGTTLFINMLPCPSCTRTLSQTDITEVVYSVDHSNGYAVKLLELCGKKVRRIVT